MAKSAFSSGTFSHLKQIIRKDVINSPKDLPEFRKEIARVFQMANRRIQNIEKRGEFSPAVISLGKGDITAYSKFAMSGNSWVELKKEYSKAMTFLQQPTSTATGTHQYNEHLRKTYDLTKKDYDLISDNLHKKLQSISDSDYVERYLMRYKDFTGDLESSAKDISSQLESDAVKMVDHIENTVQAESQAELDSRNKSEKALINILKRWDYLK